MKQFLKISILSLLVPVLVVPGLLVTATTPSEERQALERELQQLEAQIAQYEENIAKTEQQKTTLESKIATLKNKIKKLDLQISQSNIVIEDLGLQIKDTENSIDKTSQEIEAGRERLSAILQEVNEEDQRSLIEVLLSEGINDFFDNLASLEALNVKNRELLASIKTLKTSLEEQKQALDEEKSGLEKQVVIQTLQRQESQNTKAEQDALLKLTEQEYQKQLTEKTSVEKQAQAIRSRIFELIGVPEAPTFEEAYNIAKVVSGQTGVRTALLLAVLTQESNVGKNVGQCFLTDTQTGAGKRATTGAVQAKVMSPSRDVSPFLTITQELGRDWQNTPVSCPMSIGWGGAMGPSQFIPSTWMMYKTKFQDIKGSKVDPWNIADAFLATGVYLKDLGAINNEFKAVMKYFSGASWSKWEEFYGRSVLAIATQYEADIKEMSK